MADLSKIEWLYNPYTGIQGASWNRWWGCTRESDACTNCYIKGQPPLRMRGLRFDSVARGGKTGIVMAPAKTLLYPLHWRKPRMIFVESLGDLWHATVNIRFTAQMYAVMLMAPWHVFITLTKRTRRMRNWLRSPRFSALVSAEILQIATGGEVKLTSQQIAQALEYCRCGQPIRLPAHIWTGTTVEDNDMAALRIPLLLDVAPFTSGPLWLSCEPLTNEIDDPLNLRKWIVGGGIDWIVFGGESGPAAKATAADTAAGICAPGLRPISIDNLRRLVERSRLAGIPTFVKQLGEPWAAEHYTDKDLLRADKASRVITEWPEQLQVREYPLALAKHTLTVDPDNQLALAALQPRSVMV